MARDLVLDVIAKKNSRELSTLADEFDRLTKKSDSAGKSFQQTGGFSRLLDKEISNTKAHVRELGLEFERTGNKDVFAKLRGAQGNLRGLEKIRKDLANALDDGAADAAPKVTERLAEASASPYIAAGIAAGIIAASPVIGAAISSVVLSGIGVAGIAGAVALQLRDPLVKQAAADSGTYLLDGLTRATRVFAPLTTATVDKFVAMIARHLPEIEATFERLAGPAGRFADSLVSAAEILGPSFGRVLDAAGPVLDEMAVSTEHIAIGMKHFFDSMARSGPGAVAFIHDFSNWAGITLTAIGRIIEGLSGLYAFVDRHDLMGLNPLPMEIMDRITGQSGQFGALIRSNTDDLAGMGAASRSTASDIDSVARSLRGTIDTMSSLDNATLAYKASVFALQDAIKANGKAWDENTRAGLANRQALQVALDAAERKRQADIAAGASARDAAAAYNAEVERLLALAKAAGASKAELERLRGEYEITIRTRYVQIGQGGGSGGNRAVPAARAAGGPVRQGVPYVVGERRPELFVPESNGYVLPQVPARTAGAGAGAGGVFQLVVAPGSGDAVAELINRLVNTGRIQLRAA